MPFAETPRRVFQRRCQRVIPAVKEAHKGDHRYNLENLVLAEVPAQFFELRIAHGIRRLSGGLRKAQRGALGFAELSAGLKSARLLHLA